MNYPKFKGRRILIIGRPCSGKTTLASKLSLELGTPAYDMDDFYWKKGWCRVNNKEVNEKLAFLLAGEKWIISGDYLSTLDDRLAYATDIVVLDVRWYIAAFRYFKRIINRTSGNERHAGYGKWHQEFRMVFFLKKIVFYKLYSKKISPNMNVNFLNKKIHYY